MVNWSELPPSPILLEAHKTRHQDGGADEVDVTGLSGLLADDQHVLDSEVLGASTPDAMFWGMFFGG